MGWYGSGWIAGGNRKTRWGLPGRRRQHRGALREAGLAIPQDISVSGFDSIPEAARAAYDITSFEQPLTAMVRRGLDLLTARIADPGLPDEAITLRGTLIARGSTRRPGASWSGMR